MPSDPQIWFCEKCFTIGAVMFSDRDSAWDVSNRIKAAHIQYRPNCRGEVRCIALANIKKDKILCTGK